MHSTVRRFIRSALLTAALFNLSPVTAAESNYQLTTLAEGLDYPWSIAFLPDGSHLVVELAGNLRRMGLDGELGPPITGVPAVFRASQGGLFDVTLHPQFSDNQLIYLSFAQGDNDSNATTVVRGRLEGDKLNNVETLFSVTPRKYAPLHYGGRLAWLADGTLLLTTGDGFDFREQAQNLQAQLGKTIRMRDDGSAPANNPFPDTPYIWTYGHRNPQGLAVDAQGNVYQHEHGPRGGDEVNLLQPGNNYGWPAITYGMDYNGAYVSPFTELDGMEQPLHMWDPSIAPSGLMIYEGSMFPQWRGALFVGALVNQEVRLLQLAEGKVVNESSVFTEIGERIRDIREAPDGSIYILTDGEGGRVIRVSQGN